MTRWFLLSKIKKWIYICCFIFTSVCVVYVPLYLSVSNQSMSMWGLQKDYKDHLLQIRQNQRKNSVFQNSAKTVELSMWFWIVNINNMALRWGKKYLSTADSTSNLLIWNLWKKYHVPKKSQPHLSRHDFYSKQLYKHNSFCLEAAVLNMSGCSLSISHSFC